MPEPTDENASAVEEAVKADRTRRTSIMALAEAKGREKLADRLHATTNLSVDDVKDILAAAPAAAGAEELDPAAAHEKRRMEAMMPLPSAGLHFPLQPRGVAQAHAAGGLVADMRRRHGLKTENAE